MSFRMLVVIGTLLILSGDASGQEERKEAGNATPNVDPQAVEARFADDSVMKLVLLQDVVPVVTRFGRLSVPTREIRRIDLGVRIPSDTAQRIDRAIADLASSEYKRREKAGKDLLELRELALPALRKASKLPSVEVADHSKKLLKTLEATIPAEILSRSSDDRVVTDSFTIVGRIDGESVKARTTYFGERNIRLSELRLLRWIGSTRETNLIVDATVYGDQELKWYDTRYVMSAGAKVRFTATGTIDLWPVAPEVGVYTANPDGMAGGGGGMVAQGRGVARIGQQHSPGALIGRIGLQGKPFLIGSKYEGTITEDGTLWLRIVASPWGNSSSGSYEVRVNADGQ